MSERITLVELINNESFCRFVNEDATLKEREYWTNWINEDIYNKSLFGEAEFLLRQFQIKSGVETDDEKEWSKIEFAINPKKVEKEIPWGFPEKKALNLRVVLSYAALFLLVSLFGIGELISRLDKKSVPENKIASNVVVSTPYKELKTLKFSDGSKIILAPDSKIIYKSNWLSQPVKKLKLIGEAYFDIAGGFSRKAKFQIKTDQAIIKDYGTKFDISTFDNKTSVVLEKGIVSVERKRTDVNEGSPVVKLQAGEMATMSTGKPIIDIQEVNPLEYTSWRLGTIHFNNTPLSQFLEQIKHFYGVHIVVLDSTLLKRTLNDGIDRSSLGNMLKVVSRVLNIQLNLKNNTVYVGNYLETKQ